MLVFFAGESDCQNVPTVEYGLPESASNCFDETNSWTEVESFLLAWYSAAVDDTCPGSTFAGKAEEFEPVLVS